MVSRPLKWLKSSLIFFMIPSNYFVANNTNSFKSYISFLPSLSNYYFFLNWMKASSISAIFTKYSLWSLCKSLQTPQRMFDWVHPYFMQISIILFYYVFWLWSFTIHSTRWDTWPNVNYDYIILILIKYYIKFFMISYTT